MLAVISRLGIALRLPARHAHRPTGQIRQRPADCIEAAMQARRIERIFWREHSIWLVEAPA